MMPRGDPATTAEVKGLRADLRDAHRVDRGWLLVAALMGSAFTVLLAHLV